MFELKPNTPGNELLANLQVAQYCAESGGLLTPGNAQEFMAQFGQVMCTRESDGRSQDTAPRYLAATPSCQAGGRLGADQR